MSALPCATNSRDGTPLFALKGQTGGIGAISSLTVSSILVESSEIGLGGGEYISSIGGQLFYYNGSVLEPISALSSISSIEAWSEYPAISTLNLAGENLIGGNIITGSQVSTTQATVSSLTATELSTLEVAFSSMTGEIAAISTIGANQIVTDFIGASGGTFSTLLTSSIAGDTATFSSITADNALINVQLTASSIGANDLRVSTIVADDISTFTLTAISTIHSISSISSAVVAADQLIGISSINGQPISFYEPGSVSTVSTFLQLGTSSLTTSTLNGFVPDQVGNWAQYAANGQVDLGNNTIYSGGNSADDVKVVAERYVSLKGEKIYINADEGSFDIINNSLIQLSTTNGFRGEIDIIANEGNALGGKITLTANGGDIGGLLYGGVIELTANTGGGFIPTPAFTSAIRLSAASILEYSGATNSIGSVAGYGFYHGDAGINITAGVPPLAPNDPLTVYLYGTNGVLVYSPMYVYGPIRPYSDLTNNPQDLYIEDWSNGLSRGYIQLRGVSTIGFKGGDTAILGVNRLQFSTIGGAMENVSSINGQPISYYEPGGVSTLSTFTELNTSSLVASTIQTLDISANSLLNISSINGLPISELINVSSISSLNEWSYFPALSTLSMSGNDIIGAANITASGTITTGGAVSASTVSASTMTGDTIATGFIQGTGQNMYGIPGFNDGITIRASTLAITSTPLIAFTGFLNASTCSFFQANIRDINCSTITASTMSTGYLGAQQIYTNAFDTSVITVNLISSVSSVSFAAQNLATQTSSLTAGNISTGAIVGTGATLSSLSLFQQGAIGYSSLMYVSSSFFNPPGFNHTSTTLYVNTDVSLGTNDLFCQSIRLGISSLINQQSEIVMYSPDGNLKTIGVNNGDATIRIASTVNSVVANGYLLDTRLNPPFFSTLSGTSTAMMAVFPASSFGSIGVSTLSLLPAPLPLQMFGVSTFQAAAFDILLPQNYKATNYGIQITPMANTTNAAHASTVSVSSFQVHAGGGVSIGIPFFWQTIGMNY